MKPRRGITISSATLAWARALIPSPGRDEVSRGRGRAERDTLINGAPARDRAEFP
jgi:hypothetical protein